MTDPLLGLPPIPPNPRWERLEADGQEIHGMHWTLDGSEAVAIIDTPRAIAKFGAGTDYELVRGDPALLPDWADDMCRSLLRDIS